MSLFPLAKDRLEFGCPVVGVLRFGFSIFFWALGRNGSSHKQFILKVGELSGVEVRLLHAVRNAKKPTMAVWNMGEQWYFILIPCHCKSVVRTLWLTDGLLSSTAMLVLFGDASAKP